MGGVRLVVHLRLTFLRRAIASFLTALALAAPAAAQVTLVGSTNIATAPDSGFSAFSDVAFDGKHDVFLVVWNDVGYVLGRFVNFDGTPQGASFTIARGDHPGYLNVRAAYSSGAGDDVFFVLFTDRAAFRATVQRVRYTGLGPSAGDLVGATFPVSQESTVADDVVFNPVRRQFAIATYWTEVLVSHWTPGGERVGSVVNVSGAPQYVWGTRLAYDWQSDRYNIRYATNYDRRTVARTLDSALIPGEPWLNVPEDIGGSGATSFLPEVGRFVVTSACGVSWANVCTDTGPSPRTTGVAVDFPWHDFNSSVAYDAWSRRVLVAAETWLTATSDPQRAITVAELDGAGQRIGTAAILPGRARDTVAGLSARAARTGQFAISYILQQQPGNVVYLDRFSLPPASSPGPRYSSAEIVVDGPSSGVSIEQPFKFGGWTLDWGATASDGTGIDAVHVWAFPSGGGSPVFAEQTTQFHDRSDVAGIYGGHYLRAGFDVFVNGLPPGEYTLVPYVRSVLSGTFTRGRDVHLTVSVVSRPVMSLDAPPAGSTVESPFTVGGWAVDLNAASGAGIDTIHVWAFPEGGGPGVFVGLPELQRPRDDIASIYGGQFLNSGFRMDDATLAPGRYRLVAYARSSVTGTFTISQAADITVIPRQSHPFMALDGPADNATLPQPFLAGGWAIDTGATSGSGVDAIHVWAFPVVNGVVDAANAQFVAQGTSGGARPDVGAVYGEQFTNSGYTFVIGGLPAGEYILGVYARSAVSGTFNNAKFARITVQ